MKTAHLCRCVFDAISRCLLGLTLGTNAAGAKKDTPCQRLRFSGAARLILPLLMLWTLSAAVHAQTNGTTADGFNYSATNGQIAITGYSGSGDAVTIPSTIPGVSGTVTSIGSYALEWCTNLTDVTIPDSVTSIGDGAFEGCTSLTSVSMGNGVTSIGDDAFCYCYRLKTITVDVLNLSYSSSLDGVLFNKSQTTLIQYPGGKVGSYTIPAGVTSIGARAFDSCSRLSSVTIPASVTSIGESAFDFCAGLTAITVDVLNLSYSSSLDGVLFNKSQTTLVLCPQGKIGSYAIPAGVTSIGNGALSGCAGLTSVTIPASVASIGNRAFQFCTSLTSAVFMGNAPTMDWGVFDYTASGFAVYFTSGTEDFSTPTWEGYPSAILGSSPTVANSTAVNITSTTATLGGKVTTNGGAMDTVLGVVFAPTATNPNPQLGGTGVTNVTGTGSSGVFTVYVSGLTPVTQYTFAAYATNSAGTGYSTTGEFTTLYEFDFTVDSGTSITITRYTGLGGDVSIPATITNGGNTYQVTGIGDWAFGGCSSLTSVTIPAGVTSIGMAPFGGCGSLAAITVDTLNDNYGILDGVLFNKSQTKLIQYPGGKAGTYTIPSGLTSIGDYAFYYSTGLTSVTIPASVTSIGDGAFVACTSLSAITVDSQNGVYSSSADGVLFNISQTALIQCPGGKAGGYTIPYSVTNIGDGAFGGCTSLTSVAIPDSVTSIGGEVFSGCNSLTSVSIGSGVTNIGHNAFSGCTSLTSVSIGSGVTNIGPNAFDHCTSLTSVAIPHSVTTIGPNAFYSCSGLTSVTIPDSVTSIGDDAFYDCSDLTSAVFMGNAPSMGMFVFGFPVNEFTIYYFNGKAGFVLADWGPYQIVSMGDPSPASIWLITNGLPFNANLQEDPNSDGVNLLMAYALNLDPNQNLSGSMPQPVFAGNQMHLTFFAGNSDVNYTVESSTDLQHWSTDGVTLSDLDAISKERTATVDMTSTCLFMRLVVDGGSF